jgi:hypothetical protein
VFIHHDVKIIVWVKKIMTSIFDVMFKTWAR